MTGVESKATTGYGTFILRGDGGVGAGVQASKTIGATTHQLKILAKKPGIAGNLKTFGIIVDVGTVPYSQVITKDSVLINAATTSGTVTTTVAQAIAALYLDPVFAENFQATSGTGDGSSILIAGAAAVLSGGTDGVEVFTKVAEVKDITGPQLTNALVEVTHMNSPDAYREYITSFKDAGEVTYQSQFINDTTQQNVRDDFETGRKGNYQIQFVTQADGTTTAQFKCVVTKVDHAFPMAGAIMANVTLKVSGPVDWDA